MNPFLHPQKTPFDAPQFNSIQTQDYEEAFMEGIRRDTEQTEQIADNPEQPTFENTIAACENTGSLLTKVSNIFFNLLSAETNDEMDALAQKMSPILTEHANNILHNERLFSRVKFVYENPGQLNKEEHMLLEKSYNYFVRGGALLNKDDKEQYRQISGKLNMLCLQFSQNLLKDTNNFSLHITSEDNLSGLPDSAREAARMAAREQNKEGWIFTLHAPSYNPFMTYADNRDLRRKMYIARNTLCTHSDKYNNEEIVRNIVNLRLQMAQLLGYKTYADMILCHRMAESKDNVYALFEQLQSACLDRARADLEAIKEKARKTEGKDIEIMPWDLSYYAHKLELELFNIDAEMLRPYFELKQVIKGVFGLATTLYGITFHESNIPVYNPEVKAYEVYDHNGTFLALLYTDFHPRPTKRNGAWMTSFKEQWIDQEGTDHRPFVSIVMNLTKPTEERPALLSLGEVETFLHEFGHALHGIFSHSRFQSLSGTQVYWDFVELPSQIMENFAIERDFLNTFAKHYQTGEPIPEELLKSIVRRRNFQTAYACIRQVGLGMLDMAYYTIEQPLTENLLQFEQHAYGATQLLPYIKGTCMTTQFSHIMSGGYAAGYYSYKWAEVLEADAFALFKEHGIFSQKIANSFRNNILSRGGTEPPMDLYTKFRGKQPDINALLTRMGIPNTTKQ